jgi:hypothetical protein
MALVEAIWLHNFGVKALLDRLMGRAPEKTSGYALAILDLELAVEQNLSYRKIS